MSFRTLFTNDFRGCHPTGNHSDIKPISLVCKASEVIKPGETKIRHTVKLSDNPDKVMSNSSEEIQRYKRVFGVEGMNSQKVVV